MKGEIMEVVSSSKYMGSCFSQQERPQEIVKNRVGEELKYLCERKMMFNA